MRGARKRYRQTQRQKQRDVKIYREIALKDPRKRERDTERETKTETEKDKETEDNRGTDKRIYREIKRQQHQHEYSMLSQYLECNRCDEDRNQNLQQHHQQSC